MVKRYCSFMIAAVLMLMAPMVMACGTGQLSIGTDVVYKADSFKAVSVNALDAAPGLAVAIQNSGLFETKTAYKQPNSPDKYRMSINDGKVTDNVLATAYPGRYSYSGVTAA